MEASENAGPPRPGRGGPDLQRVDPARVRETLRDPASDRGYERLALMLDTILPRLIEKAERGRSD
jgi:hypothetical protein